MAFGAPERVDDYITDWRVHTIDVGATIQQARRNMEANNTDFLVVTRNGEPAYILKKYQTVLEDPTAIIESIAEKLKPTVVVESGSPWYAVSPRLGESTILVVARTHTEPQKTQILGTISVYDVKWKQR